MRFRIQNSCVAHHSLFISGCICFPVVANHSAEFSEEPVCLCYRRNLTHCQINQENFNDFLAFGKFESFIFGYQRYKSPYERAHHQVQAISLFFRHTCCGDVHPSCVSVSFGSDSLMHTNVKLLHLFIYVEFISLS